MSKAMHHPLRRRVSDGSQQPAAQATVPLNTDGERVADKVSESDAATREAVLRCIGADCRHAPDRYLDETETPFGGE